MPQQITGLLHAWNCGDDRAADRLLPLVYDQLRLLASRYMRSERPDHTLGPTAIVHEAYLKLSERDASYTDRVHFYAVAARAMRQILLDWARSNRREKRGSGALKVELEDHHAVNHASPDAVIEIDRLLQRLKTFDERKTLVVELIFFGGMTYDEVAALLNVTPVTVHRDLKMAKAWMHSELTAAEAAPVA